jgi:molybdopterin-guanine dinucleotide biosynthesis protein A
MKGLVLCGGQSSRMGTDKGLILHEARSWAQTAACKLSTLAIPVLISVNDQQYEAYQHIFPGDDIVPDHTALAVKGPLLGILSAHHHYPGEDIFVLACDMPLMDVSILKQLFEEYSGDKENDCFVFTNDGEPEPLCAIYTAGALKKIISTLEDGKLIKYSMKFALSLLRVHPVPLAETQKPYFRNFNAHAAWNGL